MLELRLCGESKIEHVAGILLGDVGGGADVIARYKRIAGVDTHFVMGNDEHSQNVYKKAIELGKDPLAYCDEMEREFRSVWKELGISFDDFIRTTEPRHRAATQKLAFFPPPLQPAGRARSNR